jgi:D-alanine-D-alanine ligase
MKKIAVLSGGVSSERVISIKTAKQLSEALDKNKFKTYIADIGKTSWNIIFNDNKYAIDKNDFSVIINGEKLKFDYALIAIHGTLGEDGLLQAYFNMMGIPYSGCDVLTSAVCFNKNFCKQYLRPYNITMAKSIMIKAGQDYDEKQIIDYLGLPVFVKPNTAGSSFGISKVKDINDLNKAIKNAFTEDSFVMIESFIDGTEVSCGVFKSSKKQYVFPLTEIDTKNEFFDYEAKYTPGVTDEITPARISDEMTMKVQKIASEVYDILNCKGLVRIDFIITNNIPHLLEVNTVPGMSAESIVPQQIRAAGYTVSQILTEMILD